MMDYNQFRELVVAPTLQYLDEVIPYSEEAVDLLMMTAAHESNGCSYIKQIKGPALGVYQMEPATEMDIWKNFLSYKDGITRLLLGLCSDTVGIPNPMGEPLITNLAYATAMARVHYYRAPFVLPKRQAMSKYLSPESREEDYLQELARYAKKYYNTELGKATAEDYLEAFKRWRNL